MFSVVYCTAAFADSSSKSVFLKLECTYKPPGDPVKVQIDSVGLGWGLRFCVSNKLPDGPAAGGLQNTL